MQTRAIAMVIVLLVAVGLFMYMRYGESGQIGDSIPPCDELDSLRPAVVSVWSSLEGEPLNQGSGFIVSEDGLVLTSLHVLANGDKVVIWFDAGVSTDEYVAEVVASDSDFDIAILKIDASGFEPIQLKSGSAHQGHSVWALGYPSSEGLDAERMTVTSGIVSRITPDENGVPLIIQTDAYMTYGSSGGPLYDTDVNGVIGICMWSQHDVDDKPLTGINYALSIEKVLELFGEYF